MDEGISITVASFLKITFTDVFLIIKVIYLHGEKVEIGEKCIKRRKIPVTSRYRAISVVHLNVHTHMHTCDQRSQRRRHTIGASSSFPLLPPTFLGVGLTPPGRQGKSSWKVPTAQLHALEAKLTLVFWSLWWLLQSSPWKGSSQSLPGD